MFPPAAWAALMAGFVPTAGPDAPHADTVPAPTDADTVPARFRLPAGPFHADMVRTHDLPGSAVEVFAVRFPSAVASRHGVNNTVHAEYFRPKGVTDRRPAAVVFDILDGAGVVSRGQAVWLAAQGVPAVCVTLPYYGPRRPSLADSGGEKLRFLSPDIPASLANVRQGVLDGRRAVSWMANRPEVDSERITVVGTSLGSFVAALVAAAEPRVSGACLLLGGGGLVDAFATHPKAAAVLPLLALVGLTKEALQTTIAPVDPLTYADLLKPKRLLMIGASRDDVVPPIALTRLWEATGKPKIVWYDATHVGAAGFGFAAMREIHDHVTGRPSVPLRP